MPGHGMPEEAAWLADELSADACSGTTSYQAKHHLWTAVLQSCVQPDAIVDGIIIHAVDYQALQAVSTGTASVHFHDYLQELATLPGEQRCCCCMVGTASIPAYGERMSPCLHYCSLSPHLRIWYPWPDMSARHALAVGCVISLQWVRSMHCQ